MAKIGYARVSTKDSKYSRNYTREIISKVVGESRTALYIVVREDRSEKLGKKIN